MEGYYSLDFVARLPLCLENELRQQTTANCKVDSPKSALMGFFVSKGWFAARGQIRRQHGTRLGRRRTIWMDTAQDQHHPALMCAVVQM